MDEEGFRQFLKRAGKKEHVIDGLVQQVQAFEDYLAAAGRGGLELAGEPQLHDYVQTLDPKRVKARMRGLALYFSFGGNEPLARRASEIREQRIAKTRQAFKLRGFRGVDLEGIDRLEAAGVVTVEDMLQVGSTPQARRRLSEGAGVAPEMVLELVKLSDLSRLEGVKGVRARLYYDAGLDTPAKFTEWEPEALRHYLIEWVARTGFEGIAPLPKELRNAIATARQLPEVVQY
jgi:hypothetical protein